MFRKFDDDGSGSIDKEEMVQIIKGMNNVKSNGGKKRVTSKKKK